MSRPDDTARAQRTDSVERVRVPVQRAGVFGGHEEHVEADAEVAWQWDARRWERL